MYAEKYKVGETWVNEDESLDWHNNEPLRIVSIDKSENKIFYEICDGPAIDKDYFQVGSLVSDALVHCPAPPPSEPNKQIGLEGIL